MNDDTQAADFELKWRVGARTASLIYMTARRFQSEITLARDGLVIPIKGIMEIMLLALDAGDHVRFEARGPDAPAALAAFTELFTIGDRLDRCPHHDCPSTPILLGYTDRWISYGCSKWHFWAAPREESPMRRVAPFYPTQAEGRA